MVTHKILGDWGSLSRVQNHILYRPSLTLSADILGHDFPNKQEVIYFKHLLKLTTILGRTNSWDILTAWDGQIFWDERYVRTEKAVYRGGCPT